MTSLADIHAWAGERHGASLFRHICAPAVTSVSTPTTPGSAPLASSCSPAGGAAAWRIARRIAAVIASTVGHATRSPHPDRR